MKRLFLFLICCVFLISLCGCSGEDMVVQGMGYDDAKIGWGLKEVENSQPEVPESWKELLKKYDGYYLGNTDEKVMYLTFDEGYENGYTAKILDVLKNTNTPAAFFVTGPYLKGQEEIIKRMIEEGHIIGNHTVNHLNLPKQSPETVENEIVALNTMCEEMYGYKMTYMRPPEGEFSEKTLDISNSLGMRNIMWSFAYKDWDINAQKGADYAYQSVMPYLHNGCVILLHAVSSDNASALERIINDAKAQGYTFKSLDEL